MKWRGFKEVERRDKTWLVHSPAKRAIVSKTTGLHRKRALAHCTAASRFLGSRDILDRKINSVRGKYPGPVDCAGVFRTPCTRGSTTVSESREILDIRLKNLL